MKRKDAKPEISPEDYRKTLDHVQLISITMDACSVKVNRGKADGNINLNVKNKASYSIEDEKNIVVASNYDLVATKTTKKEFALKIMCTYRVVFSTEEPVTDDFMDVFMEINVPMNTWPYFREFVQNMVQRSGFPQLTLPLLKR